MLLGRNKRKQIPKNSPGISASPFFTMMRWRTDKLASTIHLQRENKRTDAVMKRSDATKKRSGATKKRSGATKKRPDATKKRPDATINRAEIQHASKMLSVNNHKTIQHLHPYPLTLLR